MTTLRHAFTRALAAAPGRVHLAAHSHHLWPDAVFEGHAAAAMVAASEADRKWDTVFGAVIPEVAKGIAATLGLPGDGETLAFAPNTHDFVVRLLSALPAGRPITIVTTDSEFHSFERQVSRLEESGEVVVTRVPTAPFATFPERFVAAARAADPDLIFFSHVSFRSGAIVPDLDGLVAALPARAAVVIDGYHGFFAVPTDLSRLADRVFYLAGGYKYAMSGEGCCFLHAPPGVFPRPRNTGWFAAFGALEGATPTEVPFAVGGGRFYGATFDPTGLFRLRAALRFFQDVGWTPARARAHAHALQAEFLKKFSNILPTEALVVSDEAARGQFLTYDLADARPLCEALLAAGVIVDVRDTRLRFGFGAYTDNSDLDEALARLQAIHAARGR